MSAGARTPVTPGAVFRAHTGTRPDWPGLRFVMPWDDVASGRPRPTPEAWPAPIVLVDGNVAPVDVIEAAAWLGGLQRCGQQLRREAQAWAHSQDCQRNPHLPTGDDVGWYQDAQAALRGGR